MNFFGDIAWGSLISREGPYLPVDRGPGVPNLMGSPKFYDTGTESTVSSEPSILERLICAEPSHLARKRKVKTNPPPIGVKRSQRARNSTYTPKSITPHQRVKEFSNEGLVVSGGKLFCSACREEIGLKAQVIRLHLQSKKHATGKERLKKKKVQDVDIAESFKAYSSKEHVVGETLSSECQVYRIKAIKAFLKAGVPLNKIDCFRDILEEHGTRLAGRRTLSDLVQFVRELEEKNILEEIKGKKISIIFDGTTRMGEALAVLIRFVSAEWDIQQRLIRLQLLAKSLTGDEVARELITNINYPPGTL